MKVVTLLQPRILLTDSMRWLMSSYLLLLSEASGQTCLGKLKPWPHSGLLLDPGVKTYLSYIISYGLIVFTQLDIKLCGQRLTMSRVYRPVNVALICSTTWGSSGKNLSRTPGLARTCWTFLVPARWVPMSGHFTARERSIRRRASQICNKIVLFHNLFFPLSLF